MNVSHRRFSGGPRRASLTRRIAGGLAAAWLIFVVYLDIQHALFPKTTIGGLEILAAALILLVLAIFIGKLTMRICRLLTGGKNRRGTYVPSSHAPS